MQKPQLASIFRIFSANDWNQPALFLPNSSFSFKLAILPTFYSNAEKLRKTAPFHPHKSALESLRTNWDIGLTILFSFILKSSKTLTWFR